MFKILRLTLLPFLLGTTLAAEPMPIDPLWRSERFRKAFTGSYGIDARIEPKVTSEEKAVLDTMASEMAANDRRGAIAKLLSSSLLNQSAALIFNLGNLRFEEGKVDDAIENFERAIELYPNFRDAHRNLAVALVQEGNFEKAEPHLVRAAELGAQDGLTFGLLGYVHLNAERHAGALQAYRMAQVTMPDEPQWKIGEAESLLALGATREAESLFGQLLEKRPTESGLWLNQANIWLQTGESNKAIANLEWVRRMKTLPASGLMTLGHLYLGKDLQARAMAAWEEALAAKRPAALENALGALDHLTRLMLWEEAAEFAGRVETTYEISPNSQEAARLSRARTLIEFETGDAEVAVERIEALVAKDPLDGQALLLLAKFRERKGRREEAFILLEQAAADKETAADALLLHGQLLVESGDAENALPLLENVLELKPDPNLEAYVEEVRLMAERLRL